MADSMTFNIANRYASYDTTTDYDPTINRGELQEKLEQEQKDKSSLSFTDMLGLMVAQFQNQSIDNQASTSDMMNQLVQMSSMQAMTEMTTQIKELTLANVMAYSASLVGRTVTIGVYNEETKELEEIVGVVEGCGTYDGQQVIYVDGKGYLLSSIMAVGTLPPRVEDPKPDEGDEGGTDPVDPPAGGGDGTDPVDPPAGGGDGTDPVDPPAEGGSTEGQA